MYSVVLAVALASNSSVPGCHWRWSCCDDCCYGNYGYCDYGWYGGYGYGYYGGWCAVPVMPATMQAAAATPARLVVQLPADAKLFVDDRTTSSGSAERTFVTPALEPGYVYTYTLRAEVVRDGEKYVETQKVAVTAGGVSQLAFTETAMTRANGGQAAVASAGR
jgi:uncharacterized protein (TIGR03000 family)